MKYQCLVLCLKTNIPRKIPVAPHSNPMRNSRFSGTRHLSLIAARLSLKHTANPIIFISINTAIIIFIIASNNFRNFYFHRFTVTPTLPRRRFNVTSPLYLSAPEYPPDLSFYNDRASDAPESNHQSPPFQAQ